MEKNISTLLEEKIEHKPKELIIGNFPKLKVFVPDTPDILRREAEIEVLKSSKESISQYVEDALPIEKESMGKILNRINDRIIEHTYPKINLELLSSTILSKINKKEVHLPKFGVFDVFSESGFGIDYALYDFKKLWGCDVTEPRLPNKLEKPIVEGIKIKYKNNRYYGSCFDTHKISAKIKNKLFIIPQQVKENILDAKKYFKMKYSEKVGKFLEREFSSSIFLIAEVQPEDWNQIQVYEPVDPLVVGVHNSECYLIDSFGMTPLEELIIKKAS